MEAIGPRKGPRGSLQDSPFPLVPLPLPPLFYSHVNQILINLDLVLFLADYSSCDMTLILNL